MAVGDDEGVVVRNEAYSGITSGCWGGTMAVLGEVGGCPL